MVYAWSHQRKKLQVVRWCDKVNTVVIDTHAHLQWNKFDGDRSEVVKRAVDAGVTKILTLATDLQSSYRVVELAEEFAEVFAAVGIHPTDAKNAQSIDLQRIAELAQHPKVVAIGETGMDLYWEQESRAIQEYYFQQQMLLAIEKDLPVVVHNRDAGEATLAAIFALKNKKLRGVFHCFAEDETYAEKVVQLGFYISFTGNITYKKSPLPKVSSSVPLDRLLLETDSPFMAPIPQRGQRNEPVFIKKKKKKHAEIRGLSYDEIARQTSENAQQLFRFPQ